MGMKYINSYENKDVISLFSGAMGLDLGLIKAGLHIKIGQDFDKVCIATMKLNNYEAIPGDIRDISPELLLAKANLKQGEPLLICGGPPCQPFSTAGKRLGINDPRGSLFMDFIRMVGFIRPRFFIMENVKGLISAPLINNGIQVLNETVLDVVLSEFHKLGYKTVYGLLDAVNYGVPQFRERFVIIGSRDHEDIFLPVPTHFPKHQCVNYLWNTLKNAIGDLENAPGAYMQFSEERLNYLKKIPEGGNWRNLSSKDQISAMGGAYKSGGGKVGFYRRLSYTEPSPTLVTSPVQKASMFCHPTQDRALSVREYARIQQFPDYWKFSGTLAEQYKQIGNAVPVGLGEALGNTILSIVNGKNKIQTKRFRGTDVHSKIQNALCLGVDYANKHAI